MGWHLGAVPPFSISGYKTETTVLPNYSLILSGWEFRDLQEGLFSLLGQFHLHFLRIHRLLIGGLPTVTKTKYLFLLKR